MEQQLKELKASAEKWNNITSMQSQRWCCIQDVGNGRHWFFEPSISYTRKESIRLLTDGGALTWRQLKAKYGWRCSKIFLTLLEF